MRPKLADKVALVSGVSEGIGGAIARRFAAEGAKVMCTGVQMDVITAIADDIQSTGGVAAVAELDVTDEAQWRAAVAATIADFDGLDILVNNAGVLQLTSIGDTSLEDFRAVHRVNVDGVFLGMKTAIAAMPKGASIINISSVSASAGCSHHVAYGSSKAAVSGMTRHVASECAANGSGIRVNAICPGVIRTPMFIDTDENFAKVMAAQPMGIGSAEDVASAAVYLASDDARWVTGTEIIVDGGRSVRT